jgi:hypothetical protein
MGFAALTPSYRSDARRSAAVMPANPETRRPSFLPPDLETPPRGGGGAVVAAGAKFDPAVHDAEIEPMDEAAIATLLTKVAHARPRPFAI